ncbi:hypothetical protein LF65_06485 [Clostridium beijerinckii]|uniref:Nudix hydrolase domain-containing protein n=1 Tax=Clostridium beijerinckii TaxID=1520 RepID=A0A140DMF4_CLOBE|nr:hypothetical protein [Clostridium beijerinckii]AMK50435.1 hypothetical protein LF65_06485 [Clostridium beijerinckii]
MDEYIKKLRKHIGNSPLPLVAAGAIIHKNRKILLQRRADSGKWAITWRSSRIRRNSRGNS